MLTLNNIFFILVLLCSFAVNSCFTMQEYFNLQNPDLEEVDNLYNAANKDNVNAVRFHLELLAETYKNNHQEFINALLSCDEITGFSPLMISSAKGNSEIVKLILDAFGEDHQSRIAAPHQQSDNTQSTALMLALDESHISIVQLLLAAYDIDHPAWVKGLCQKNRSNSTALIKAGNIINDDIRLRLVEIILNAFYNNHTERIECINNKDNYGKTVFTRNNKLLSPEASCILEAMIEKFLKRRNAS